MNAITSFATSRFEADLIHKIVNRARVMGIVQAGKRGHRTGHAYDAITCDMDITACHCNGMALDLNKLLAADDFNFAHDVCGIARHINRGTGQIEDCFVPRCSQPQTATA